MYAITAALMGQQLQSLAEEALEKSQEIDCEAINIEFLELISCEQDWGRYSPDCMQV